MARTEARASTILQMLHHVGVTHIVGLPDNASAALFTIAKNEGTIQLVSVSREAEAFAIASGLWIGGKSPVILIQNTGLLESGDGLRGTASRMGIPLLILVTCRGWQKMERLVSDSTPYPEGRDVLVGSDLDSVAFLTEPTLEAWNIPHAHYASDDDQERFETMWQIAVTQERPAALLITSSLV